VRMLLILNMSSEHSVNPMTWKQDLFHKKDCFLYSDGILHDQDDDLCHQPPCVREDEIFSSIICSIVVVWYLNHLLTPPPFPLPTSTIAALEVLDPDCPDQSAVEGVRELCGPPDPEIAKILRSMTLRAKYGLDKVQNAVHCTDLEEDGCLEVTYFFDLLQG